VAGASVTVAASGTGNTINPATASSGGNGVATFSFSSTVAELKTITATAGGVTITDQATITVQKASSTVEITSDEPDGSIAGQPVTVEFTVSGSGGTPTGDVVITISNGLPTETCTGTLSNGSGSCVLPVTQPGTGTGNRRVITATYSGDAQFSGDTDTDNHRVDPLPTTNNPPVAAFSTPSCTVGQPCQFTDGSSDSDGNIASRSWVFEDGNPATSSDQNPSVTFSSSGDKTVTLTVTDNDGATSGPTSHTVNVAAAPNSPPTAIDDDGYTTTVDVGFHAPGPNGPSLIANDTDSDGGTLSTTAETVVTSQNGSVIIGTDGSFDYTPPPGISGVNDSFSYTLNDGQGGSDTGTATVTINP
jgi:PKD repeat protein